MVIIGYQGIGKSTTSKHLDNCIDLESSNFWIETEEGREKCKQWESVYAKIALDLSSQGNIVFVSSHASVRKAIYKYNIGYKEDVVVVYPDQSIREEWLKRLKARYKKDPSTKNESAYNFAKDNYDESIQGLIDDADLYNFKKACIYDIDYDLKEIIDTVEDLIFSEYVLKEINDLPKVDFKPDNNLYLEAAVGEV
jgi:hypothetical protein